MKRMIAMLLCVCMVLGLAACGTTIPVETAPEQQPAIQQKPSTENVINLNNGTVLGTAPKGTYNEGVVLVKVEETFNAADLGELSYTSATPLYDGSKWYSIQLTDAKKTEEAVKYLSELDVFAGVDYDYVMGVTAKEEENPGYNDQTNLGLSNIPHGWTQNGKHPGGSPDVIVAVIDTGVDYNHLDLRNNIWVNNAEIAGNGKDDDGNGYIDDVYGWDFVGNDKDPMDDNGHGTHVAGIVAAENNKIGGIGVAYNCKVMVLKAGNSSGYFNNSDIAEAIQYAYMNGASVINMSFGGSSISLAVEEALENAYNTCVLVAAAGNDGACNDLSCRTCEKVAVCYPAALPYVIGVMSTDKDGKHISSFSNYDHNPYDTIEYEVYAVGEGVGSTWPSNKYACLNGTSMAAPTVAGIAALLRSYYVDREMYSTKFIQSQIVNTGTVHPHILDHEEDYAHSVADVREAMTKLPKPAVNLYDYYIDDSVSINAANNGNGVVDAGETIRLHISLHNRGGVATNVNVSIDTDRGMGMSDPYFTFVNPSIQLSDIGTYSVRESGDKYFEIVVSPDCPNDYLVDFNIRFTYNNGMDEKDKTVYQDDGRQQAQFTVSRGFLLPATITEDTVFKADKLYIVGQDVVIPEGVTVTFEEGCEIRFYDDRKYYDSPRIIVYGSLNLRGTQRNMITLAPSERYSSYICYIELLNTGALYANYVNFENFSMVYDLHNNHLNITCSIWHSSLRATNTTTISGYKDSCIAYSGGKASYNHLYIQATELYYNYIDGCCIGEKGVGSAMNISFKNGWHTRVCNYVGNFIRLDAGGILDTSLARGANVGKFEDNIICATGSLDLGRFEIMRNNYFCAIDENNISLSGKITLPTYRNTVSNLFSALLKQYASQIIDGYVDSQGNITQDIYSSLVDASLLWPHIVSVEMFDKDGNPITTVGKEEIKVRVTFNRPMDVNAGTFLTFGTIEPYGDYRIDGEYISETVWEGTYTLKAQIENGLNFLKVNNACAAEDPTKTVFGEYQLHEFTIDTTAAMAMNLQTVAKDEGIELTFAQDDYDTLLGYNIYRSESKDGNYVKLNPAILLPSDESFLDENAEPGKTYWYTYTVVLSDFTESNPAGKVQATAKDTMAPSLYHTPVNQGYAGNNLVISATASDNIAISNVTLYYRTVGSTQWKSLSMSKVNDKYNATVFGSELTLDGLEYYITATDGVSTVTKGTAETPYTVVIKSADSISRLGDVDGNGTITTKDALMLMQCLNGDLILSDDAFKRADLNGDNILSSAEALRILQYINGKVNTLEM